MHVFIAKIHAFEMTLFNFLSNTVYVRLSTVYK